MSGWREIGDRIWVRRYRFFDQAIGVVAGDDGLLVVDTRTSHRQAIELIGHLRELSPLPVRAVVNTHFHSDHVFGNRLFRPAPIWGHARCAERLRAGDGEAQRGWLVETIPERAGEWREVDIDPPDRTFAESASVDAGGRRVELRHLGRGHTDNDIVALVPDAGVLFAGDLLENGAPPSFTDAYPLDWPETISRLLDLVRGPVVPGHGDVADRAFAEAQLADLSAVASLARQVRQVELSLDEAVARGPFPAEATRDVLERALAQLRGELD